VRSGGKSITNFGPRYWTGVSGQSHASAALYRWLKDPRYPLNRRGGGTRAGLDTEAEEECFASAGDRTPVF
jgi:hypothetical protein